jgi:DNA-3-methyladenine glycosylase I
MADTIGLGADGKPRCSWCLGDDLYVAYHDEEWGRPIRDDAQLFGLLMLEGFQAGLSWRTILHKRHHFDEAFHGWDPERIAAYTPDDIARLMANPGIVRNRLKCEGAVRNAKAYLRLREEMGSFSDHLWSFVGGETIRRPRPTDWSELPATTPESDAMSKDLRKRGFTFVGSTICYAFMQSAGMVDDHMAGCFLSREGEESRSREEGRGVGRREGAELADSGPKN